MTRHLLSCSCGKTLAIEAGQAGETIRCSCGAELEVPSFREIRKLPLAVEPPTTKQSRQPVKWSLSRGLVFSIGLAIAVFGICMAGYFQWGRSRLSTEQSQWDNLEGDLAHIDTLDPIAMVDLWQMVKQVGLGFAFTERTARFLSDFSTSPPCHGWQTCRGRALRL